VKDVTDLQLQVVVRLEAGETELIGCEGREVDQCHVDALSVLDADDPWPLGVVADGWHARQIAGDVARVTRHVV